MIASQYKLPKEEGDPVVKNGVTIIAEEVVLIQKCPKDWKTFCRTKPASV